MHHLNKSSVNLVIIITIELGILWPAVKPPPWQSPLQELVCDEVIEGFSEVATRGKTTTIILKGEWRSSSVRTLAVQNSG